MCIGQACKFILRYAIHLERRKTCRSEQHLFLPLHIYWTPGILYTLESLTSACLSVLLSPCSFCSPVAPSGVVAMPSIHSIYLNHSSNHTMATAIAMAVTAIPLHMHFSTHFSSSILHHRVIEWENRTSKPECYISEILFFADARNQCACSTHRSNRNRRKSTHEKE